MSDALRWSTIVVEGDDATSFLDGQLSQSMHDVAQGRWSNVLEPTGEVISSLWVRGSDTKYELLVPSELADAVLQRLRRFLIRVRCSITLALEASDGPLKTHSDLEAAQMPWTTEFARHLMPHSFGPSYVAATVSFTKGCFTGQELVGRMDARGASMPWRFALVEGPSRDEIDRVISEFGPEGPKGVTTVLDASAVRVFAIVHRSALVDSTSQGPVRFRAVE
jgi:folate-binding protein YgfZ